MWPLLRSLPFMLALAHALLLAGCGERVARTQRATPTPSTSQRTVGRSTDSTPPTAAAGTAVPSDDVPDLFINAAGEAIFKVVIVSDAGSGGFVRAVRDLTQPAARGRDLTDFEHDAWRLVTCDFLLPGLDLGGHPVRIYLFSNEGIGFIGQPGSAKDVAYKNAHEVIALAADAEDRDQLSVVVEPDLRRLASQGQHPAYVIAAPARPGAPMLPVGALELNANWRNAPLDVLRPAIKLLLDRYR